MYNYKITICDGAHVALILFATTNSERVDDSLVVSADNCDVWNFCRVLFWLLWETSSLAPLGNYFLHSMIIFWFSGYSCLWTNYFMKIIGDVCYAYRDSLVRRLLFIHGYLLSEFTPKLENYVT
jgi:hypothetical protein